jgi:hypothetical protein
MAQPAMYKLNNSSADKDNFTYLVPILLLILLNVLSI